VVSPVGAVYRLEYSENGRMCCAGAVPALEVRIGGATIVGAHTVTPVGGSNPYRRVTSDLFVATAPDLLLAFVKGSPQGGDSTVLIDDVCISRVFSQNTTPPALVSAGSVNGFDVGLKFSEFVTPASAQDIANYSVSSGGPLTDVRLPQPALLTSFQLRLATPVNSPFTVTASGIRDLAGNSGGGTAGATVFFPGSTAGDIGAPALAGAAFSDEPNHLEIVAGGADVWDSSDQCHFVSKPLTGDFDVQVRVERLDVANTWSKAGLMARATLATSSPTIHTYVTPVVGANQIEAGVRRTAGAPTEDWGQPRPAVGSLPKWLRLTREGNAFRAFHSSNGINWTLHGQTTQAFSSALNVGLFATSHNVTQPTMAEFSHLQVFP
jgi:regulation of enolase protein 1 (concanavalin A-like superfamily)